MNVANFNPSDKPNSTDRRADASESLAEIDAITSQLKATVEEAAQKAQSFDQTERSVTDAVRKIGQQAIELFIRLQGDGDVGQIIATEEGKTLHRNEKVSCTTIRSIFGTHCFEQFTYAPAAKKAGYTRPKGAVGTGGGGANRLRIGYVTFTDHEPRSPVDAVLTLTAKCINPAEAMTESSNPNTNSALNQCFGLSTAG